MLTFWRCSHCAREILLLWVFEKDQFYSKKGIYYLCYANQENVSLLLKNQNYEALLIFFSHWKRTVCVFILLLSFLSGCSGMQIFCRWEQVSQGQGFSLEKKGQDSKLAWITVASTAFPYPTQSSHSVISVISDENMFLMWQICHKRNTCHCWAFDLDKL